MVLELRGESALGRPVAAIVHARGHFIENRPSGACEKFDGEHPHIVERIGDPYRQRMCFGELCCDCGRRRYRRRCQHAVVMHIFGRIPDGGRPVLSTRNQHREFMVERDHRLKDGRPPLYDLPCRWRIGSRDDPCLPLAVIAKPRRLEDCGGSDF